jgi:hypothetical protein
MFVWRWLLEGSELALQERWRHVVAAAASKAFSEQTSGTVEKDEPQLTRCSAKDVPI